MATGGRLVNDRAAAGGPISRLKMSRDPTTGTAMVVTSATTTRNARSIARALTPRASATSGATEESISGRYRTSHGHDARGGDRDGGHELAGGDAEDLPEEQREDLGGVLAGPRQEQIAESEHQHDREGGGDVAAGPRRPSPAISTAPARENTPRPMMVLTPIRLAPAAPAKAPLGRACAANADAAQHREEPHHAGHDGHDRGGLQALTMKPANIRPPRRFGGGRLADRMVVARRRAPAREDPPKRSRGRR